MANSDAGKLAEQIYEFRFRNYGALTIPKLVREIGYIQSLDIIVESIDFNEYRSSKTVPSESLFGYATLVFQDCFQNEKFPLRFGRNRIYSIRNEQALSQWEFQRQYYSLQVLGESLIEEIKKQIEFSQASSDAKDIEDLAAKAVENPAALAAALAAKAAQKAAVDAANLAYQVNAQALPLDPPQSQFIELPLREVYILGFSNCQFTVEFSQYQPVPYVSDRGRNNKGESRMVDGKKDKGVPKSGTSPRKNSPNSPFSNGSPPTSKTGQGDFYNDKNGDSVLPMGVLDRPTDSGLIPLVPKRYQLTVVIGTDCNPQRELRTITVYSNKYSQVDGNYGLSSPYGICVNSRSWNFVNDINSSKLTFFYDKNGTVPWDRGDELLSVNAPFFSQQEVD